VSEPITAFTTLCFERAAQRYAVRVRHLRRIREGQPGETAHDPGVGGLVTLAGGERLAELEGASAPIQIGSGTDVRRFPAPTIHPIPAFLGATARARAWAALLQDDDDRVRILLRPGLR